MKRSIFLALLTFSTLNDGVAEDYNGIDIPAGEVAFADEIVKFAPEFSGRSRPTHPLFLDPENALGVPNFKYDPANIFTPGSVSLGSGGVLILKFTNNLLTGSDDSEVDLFVFGGGSHSNDMFVEISKDGENWEPIGKTIGRMSAIDIDAFGFKSSDQFSFVKLMDDDNDGKTWGETAGAEVDAVAALSSEIMLDDSPIVEVKNAVVVSFETSSSHTYVIQETTDDKTWRDVQAGIQGDGERQQFFFTAKSSSSRFRLKPASSANKSKKNFNQ